MFTDVVIIGGGVVGCSIAYQLRKRGVRVIVLERGEIGQQASSAATGLLAPFKLLGKQDSYLALQRASLALFPSLVEELEAITGTSVEFHQTGTVRLASPKQLPRLERWAVSWDHAGVPMEVVQGDRLADLEPSLSPIYTTAVFIPGEPQVRAASFTAVVAQAARACGAVLMEHCPVVDVERSGARIVAVRTAQGHMIGCSHVVVAAGAWSAEVGSWLGLALPVRPVQGQSLLLPQPVQPVAHILFGEGIYVAPRRDHTLVVGSTHDETGFDCRVTPDGMARLLGAAQRLVPALSHVEILRAWAGLRPRTPDSRPILGGVPNWQNVTLACGHNGFGILLSAITGQAIAEVVTGNIPESIRPFGLERFSAAAA